MSIKAGVAFSKEEDSYKAGYEAGLQAVERAGGKPDITFVFSSIAFNQQEVLRGVRDVNNKTLVVGCSTAGEISNEGPTRKSVVVMAIQSDSIRFTTGIGQDIKTDPRKAGYEAAMEVKEKAGGDLQVFMTLMDGLSGNGSEVVQGALDVLGKNFVIVGGGAGDDARYKETYQYLDNAVLSNVLIGIGFSGDFKYSVGVRHGWIPVGVSMKVTKSEGSVLHEIDHNPAIKIYEDYFGEEEAKELKEKTLAELALSYPIGVKVEGSDELLLRAPFFVDKKGAITCGGAVPEGAEVSIMIGSKEDAIEAARIAAHSALKELGNTPKAVFVFNCHVRDKLFGERAKEEIAAIQEIIGSDVPMIGLYTYSEQAPIAGETRNIEKCKSDFHNETIVLFMLGE